MPFYLYTTNNSDNLYTNQGNISIAGYNLIYSFWDNNKKPLNEGWKILNSEIKTYFNNDNKYKDCKLLIDFFPSSTEEIVMMEIIDIYIYTYGEDKKAIWSPLMLKLRDCYYDDNFKEKDISKIKLYEYNEDIFEFLYISGDDRGWRWSKVGRVNGALLHKPAREYFKKYFI